MFIQSPIHSNSFNPVRFQAFSKPAAFNPPQAQSLNSLVGSLQALQELFQGLASFADDQSSVSPEPKTSLSGQNDDQAIHSKEWLEIAREKGHIPMEAPKTKIDRTEEKRREMSVVRPISPRPKSAALAAVSHALDR